MKILALEASAVAASAAVCSEDKVVGESFLDIGKTHSQTLMPLVGLLLENTDTPLAALDFLAVSTGPGSFTGLRIAIAAVKGMALGADKPCVGVSTLEALAYNLRGFEGVAAAVMDARCQQVYTALFALQNGAVTRLTPDAALPLAQLAQQLKSMEKPVFLVGDGAEMCYTELSGENPGLRLAPPHLRLQRAASVAACAYHHFSQEGAIPPAALLPAYLRLPQAERELAAKNA